MIEQLPLLSDLSRLLGPQILLLSRVNHDKFLILENDLQYRFCEALQSLSRGSRLGACSAHCIKRERDTGTANIEEQLSLVVVVLIQKGFGYLETFRYSVERRALVTQLVEQVASFLTNSFLLEVRHFIFQIKVRLEGCVNHALERHL